MENNESRDYLTDMIAATRDTPEIELKLGRCESANWTEAKIIMKYVSLIDLQLLQTK